MNLDVYIGKRDKFESLYTILVYNTKYINLISFLYDKLEKINNISNAFKKKYLNDRIYNFKEYVDCKFKKDDIINALFLVSDTIYNFTLDKEIDVLKEFSVKNILFLNDEYFKIDFIKDLLYNFDYKYVIYVNNKLLQYIKLTKTKKKVINKFESSKLDIEEYIKNNNIKELCIIHGVSSSLKNLKIKNQYIFTNKLTDIEILDFFDKQEMLKYHLELKESLLLLEREETCNRLLFGKDIVRGINYCQIKTLFCSPKKMKKVLENFSDKINFRVVEVKCLENGDIGDELRKKYSGLVGLTYY